MKVVKLNDEYNTIIYCSDNDDEAKVRRVYTEKLKAGASIREEANSRFNHTIPTLIKTLNEN
jgi:hypothetical protein